MAILPIMLMRNVVVFKNAERSGIQPLFGFPVNSVVQTHYENVPMLYTDFSQDEKFKLFIRK